MADKKPKMVKYVEDECYGINFGDGESCRICWIRRSCEANFNSMQKKAKRKNKPKPREKKYKKTDKHRDW